MSIQLQKVTATEALVEHLLERIRGGEFTPGEKLPSEQALLADYAVSRLTLREALARLAALGVIQVRHGKGAYVSEQVSIAALDNVLVPMFAQFNRERMYDLVEARNVIEAEIAAKVAQVHTEKDLELLEQALVFDKNQMTSPARFAEQDFEFHLLLSRIAGNDFLHAMYQALQRQIGSFLLQYAKSITDWQAALERHRPILEAIRAGDTEGARSLAREHAKVCASFIERYAEKNPAKIP